MATQNKLSLRVWITVDYILYTEVLRNSQMKFINNLKFKIMQIDSDVAKYLRYSKELKNDGDLNVLQLKKIVAMLWYIVDLQGDRIAALESEIHDPKPGDLVDEF